MFPDCFITVSGLTPFKKSSEYIISVILLSSAVLLIKKRERFDNDVYRLILFSIALTIISELAFTFYISVYGLSNLIGHLLKVLSFFLIYKAIIEIGFKRPYDLLLFRELSRSE